jgi:large subunit ribosomal protein L9
MKVILTKDVAKLGRIGEVKEVANGYGTNFIIARGLGLPATPANIQKVEKERAARGVDHKLENAQAKQVLAALADQAIVIKAKASESGHLFAGLHEKEIAAAVEAQTGKALPVSVIKLDEVIKTLGDYTVEIKTPTVSGSFRLSVQR